MHNSCGSSFCTRICGSRVCGSVNHPIEELDENGRQYRELYFLRRAFATVLEISGAAAVLEKSKAFEHEIGRFFSDADSAAWKAGVKFFHDNRKFLRGAICTVATSMTRPRSTVCRICHPMRRVSNWVVFARRRIIA
jgi:hypothetical protein